MEALVLHPSVDVWGNAQIRLSLLRDPTTDPKKQGQIRRGPKFMALAGTLGISSGHLFLPS